MTSYAPPTFIPECVSLMCDLFYAFNDNSDSCLHYILLKAKIKITIKLHLIQWSI